MLLITKRRQIGTICSHPIYAVSRSEMIPLPNPAVWSSIAISKNENRFVVNFIPWCLFFFWKLTKLFTDIMKRD